MYVLHRNMHRFSDISSNRSLRSQLDLSDISDIYSDSTPFIFYERIGFTTKKP